MTTLTAPSPSPVPSPTVTEHRFSPVSRGRGYHRVGGVLVAADADTRLILSLERVVVATVTHRASQAPIEVHGGGDLTARVLAAVAAEASLTGRLEVAVKAPWPRDSGCDVDTAAAYAAVAALVDAADLPITAPLRRAVVSALGGSAALPAEDGFGVHTHATGAWRTVFEDAARFNVLLWHRPGSATTHITNAGAVPTTDAPTDAPGAAAWLAVANGEPTGRLGQACVKAAADHPQVYAVLGGHTDTDPVAVLLPGDVAVAAPLAHRVRAEVATRLAGDLSGFVPTFARQSRTS